MGFLACIIKFDGQCTQFLARGKQVNILADSISSQATIAIFAVFVVAGLGTYLSGKQVGAINKVLVVAMVLLAVLYWQGLI